MNDHITLKAETTDGNVVELKLNFEETVKMIAKAMLLQGNSMICVRADDLHDATLTLQWSPKDRCELNNR